MSLDPARLADLQEIQMLSNRYARGLDSFDIEGLLAPFADDATFDASPVELGVFEGIDAIREFFEHNQSTMADQMHLFSNFLIDFDGEGEAHGSNYLVQDGHTKDGVRIQTWALNEDRYSRTPDGWRIVYRRVSALMPPDLEGYK
jgi:ketosteroid isomerase-like protein